MEKKLYVEETKAGVFIGWEGRFQSKTFTQFSRDDLPFLIQELQKILESEPKRD